jgi:UDP-N-acetylglucosamine 2-epimerase (non-hydrolysing)
VIHFVVGTRAQLLKLAPVMLECERRGLAWRWVYTAQHRETISGIVETFRLPEPSCVVVRWETEAKSLANMSRWFFRMLIAVPRSRRILAWRTGGESVVLTHGDTFTTWFGALYGKVTRTKVMHVESGLRSFNLRRPFPEEINRLITFRLADFYACPGPWAVANLAKYSGSKIDTGGNTQIDTLRFGLEHASEAVLEVPTSPYVVATIHRYENIFNEGRLRRIVAELELIARRFRVVFIRHPATELQLDKLGLGAALRADDAIDLMPRLDYLPFLKLVLGAEFVVSDGGGNQEELSYLGKPTLILRKESERLEGLGENGLLADLDPAAIANFVHDYTRYSQPFSIPDGSPSAVIVDFLEERGFG